MSSKRSPSSAAELFCAILSGFILSSFLPSDEALGITQSQNSPLSVWLGRPIHSQERNAEVVLADHLKPSPRNTRDLARQMMIECKRHHLDPAFVLSVIQVESGFRSRAISPAGAIGLLQLMPDTARHIAGSLGIRKPSREDLLDPALNLKLGIAYLAELRDRYRGQSLYYVLAAYNMGPARLDALRSKPGFKPNRTLKYYQDVMRGMNHWRTYSSSQAEQWARRVVAGGSRGKIGQIVEKRGRSI